MARSTLTSSTFSLGSSEKSRLPLKLREDSVDGDGVSRRKQRWTHQKYTSLENLSPETQHDLFKRYEVFPNPDQPLLNDPSVHTIWKAYSKFIKAAWEKTHSNLLCQTQRADASELQERSAVMQLMSLTAILGKDKEIMKAQINEVNEISKDIALMANTKIMLDECKRNRNLEIEIIVGDVKLLDQELIQKQHELAQLEVDVAGIEKELFSEGENRDRYRIETMVKREKVELLSTDYTLEREVAGSLKVQQEDIELDRKRLLSELGDCRNHLKASADELQRSIDEFDVLKKKLAEIKDFNQVTVHELNSMESRLVDQETSREDLEKRLSLFSVELDRIRMSTTELKKSNALFYGMWLVACLVQVIWLVDRRWP